MTKPLSVVREAAVAVYPLPAGAMVASLDHFPFWMHRFRGSRLRLTQTNEVIGASLCLWVEAFASQAPGGTLPEHDDELAALANYTRDPGGWARVRGEVLRGWAPVQVLDAEGGPAGRRLAHPVTTDVAVYLWGLREKSAVRRELSNARQARGRLRRTIAEVGGARVADNPDTVEGVARWLAARGLPQSKPDVRAALVAISQERGQGFDG